MKPFRLGRYYYLKFTRLQGDPHSLALGTAIGVFIGITPTIPFHTVIILCIAMLTRCSAIAAILSSWVVCNPLTYLPIYYFSMVLGNFITPFELNWLRIKKVITTLTSDQPLLQSLQDIGGLGLEAIVVMVFGGIVLAIPFGVVSYYLSLHLFVRIRRKKTINKLNINH